MANVFDVAQYILEQKGPMSAMKLQKLTYYSQAWSLVWDQEAIFEQNFQAWANGPVCHELYQLHQGQFLITNLGRGNTAELTVNQRETIEAVLETYGEKSAQWLSDLTHMEDPWLRTRAEAGLADGERGNAIINIAYMDEYYSGLMPE